MPGPPPKPKPPEDLAEVERALSVLQGRHPEHERARREQEEARTQRQADLDARAKAELVVTRKRQGKIGAIAVVAIGVVGVVAFFVQREVARRGRLEASTDSFRPMGFVVGDTSARATAGKLETVVEKGCHLAVSTDAAPIEVTLQNGAPAKGPGPVLFCTCDGEKVTLTSDVTEGGGLSIMHVDAAVLGGSRAFSFSTLKAGTALKSDESCAEASLDAWIDAKRYPAAQPDEKWLSAEPKRAPLVEAGARVLTTLRGDVPFGVAEVPKESCLLVTSDAKGDRVGLRVKGGATPFPLADQAFLWCAASDASFAILRDGKGTTTAVAFPSSKVGGIRGARVLVRESGIALGYSGVAPTDYAWDAKQLLLANGVPEGLITMASAPDVAPESDSRLVALTFGTANALTPELQTDTFSYCEPALDERMRESLCLFSGTQTWRAVGAEASGGMARAKLPFWLFGLQGVNDPVALKAGVGLISFVRRMRQLGFEPTSMEAMTEQPNGIDVLGRSGEDAIVAVGVAPAAPWVFPYTDGPAWTLEGEPHVIPIKPLEKVTLKTPIFPVPPKDKRRSVVFRRPKR